MENKPACVLYSGGADSTYAAVEMLKKHTPVHLVSYHHHRMSQLEKTSGAAKDLISKYPPGALIHRWVDMSAAWRKINARPPGGSLFGLSGYFGMLLKPCVSCKVAMHVSTLCYCKEQGIKVVADGAHPGGARLFPEQLEEGIEIISDFYRSHDILYLTPAYDSQHPDRELFEKGITPKKNTKDEHIYYTNQFACHVGLLAYMYHYLTKPFDKNKKNTFRMSLEFLETHLKEFAHIQGE